MATYSASAVFNKAANDIGQFIFQKSKEMNIPMNIMPFILDKVMLDIQNNNINELSNLTIELTNELEDTKSKNPPTPKEENKEET